MSAKPIIEQLDVLLTLHENLHKLAVQKTEVIKKGDMEKLNKLLIEEQKFVKAIEQTENKRQRSVEQFFQQRNELPPTQPSMLDVMEVVASSERERLDTQRTQLLHIVGELKQTNSLNQQLVYHSLQYVNVTLDMLRPQRNNLNYGHPSQATQGQVSRGMFDSRA